MFRECGISRVSLIIILFCSVDRRIYFIEMSYDFIQVRSPGTGLAAYVEKTDIKLKTL